MKLFLAVLFSAYLMACPAASNAAAGEAMALWARAVAPALFPFMALLPVFTEREALELYRRALRAPMRRLFRLPPEAAAAVTVGLIAGSPTGALALSRTAEAADFSVRQALTAAVLCSGCGPVFLICSVGAGMFRDAMVGVRLLICMWLSLAIVGWVTARLQFGPRKAQAVPPVGEGVKSSPVREAVFGVLTVCGWMVLFAVMGSAVPREIRPFFEVSAGCAAAAGEGNGLMAAFLCGLGGLCAGCQNCDALRGAGVKAAPFLACKALTGAISAGLYELLMRVRLPQWPLATNEWLWAAGAALGFTLIPMAYMGLKKAKH